MRDTGELWVVLEQQQGEEGLTLCLGSACCLFGGETRGYSVCGLTRREAADETEAHRERVCACAHLLLRVSGVGLETGSAGRGRIACDSTPLLPDVVAREVLPLPVDRRGPTDGLRPKQQQ